MRYDDQAAYSLYSILYAFMYFLRIKSVHNELTRCFVRYAPPEKMFCAREHHHDAAYTAVVRMAQEWWTNRRTLLLLGFNIESRVESRTIGGVIVKQKHSSSELNMKSMHDVHNFTHIYALRDANACIRDSVGWL